MGEMKEYHYDFDMERIEREVASWYTDEVKGMYKPTGGVRKQTRYWTTKDGSKIRICDMSDGHLENTMSLLKRVAIRLCCENLKFYLRCTPPTADGAQMAFDSELDWAIEATWEDFLPEVYHRLTLEAERRKV